jgi:B12 binding domain
MIVRLFCKACAEGDWGSPTANGLCEGTRCTSSLPVKFWSTGLITMKILLYNPDNEVTNNFMPHLWMFVLKSLTPPHHEVLLLDGNARRMSEQEVVQHVRDHGIGLVGIGAMTRMAAKAYRVADAIRAGGVQVVMGGPHVTEVPDEPLGRDGGRGTPTRSRWAKPMQRGP